MSDSVTRQSGGNLVWRQFLIGQSFGVAFAVALFVVEPVWLMRNAHSYFGASLTAVLAVYAASGWVLGAGMGAVFGLAGSVSASLRRADGTVAGLGPVIGFLLMALFIVRMESSQTLKSFPGTVMISLAAAVLLWIGLGYLGRRFLARYVPSAGRPLILNLLAAIALVAVVVPIVIIEIQSRRLPRRAAALNDSPNIVLVVVDALRPDHLSAYGYKRDTSPNLDRFAENAVVFTNAYSHGNRTIIAMPSLFTSLYPSFHGAAGYRDIAVPLPEDRRTLAEVCREAGYTTVGVMSNINLKAPFGMTRGFDYAEEFHSARHRLSVYRALGKMGLVQKLQYTSHAPDASVVTKRGIEWLQRVKDRPFFLFLHYMDVHHPYDPPDPYVKMFGTSGGDIDTQMLFIKTAAMVRRPPPLELSREELTLLIDLYDGCIRYTDEEVGRLLDELASLNLDRETIVIFTSDHGDEFLEHGSLYHTNLVIEPLIRVPLIIGGIPAGSTAGGGVVADGMVRHVDIMPTVAELVGGELPPFIHGGSLAATLAGKGDWDAEYSIAEGDFCTSLNQGDWKMLYVDSTQTYYLYNLEEDPLGLVDVSDSYPLEAAEMKLFLDEYLERVAVLQTGDRKQLSEEDLKQLRALGYIQ